MKGKDIIILLIGLNPIPNYISILNYCKKDSMIFLVYSDEKGNKTSMEFADKIECETKKRFQNVRINKVDISKNNFKIIYKEAEKIEREIKNEVQNTDHNLEVVLDITGSTKAISSIFYDVLSNSLSNENNINFSTSYIASEKEIIYERGFYEKQYRVEELAEISGVTKEELLAIQGYESYKNNSGIRLIKNIGLKNFTLVFYMESKGVKRENIKKDMFLALDLADKLGGNLSEIVFIVNKCNEINDKQQEEKFNNEFIKMLENNINRKLKGRIKICKEVFNN